MLNWEAIRSVTLDIAGTYDDGGFQDQVAELIWRLLERNYHIYLVSTNPDQTVDEEDFDHPGLVFLREGMPPSFLTGVSYPKSCLGIARDHSLHFCLVARSTFF